MDINDPEERTFTLMDKRNADQQQENKGTKKNETDLEETKEEMKRSTISDYLPNFFGRSKKQEEPTAEESKLLKANKNTPQSAAEKDPAA